MTPAEWERIGRATTAVWNEKRFDLALEIIAPDFTRHDPGYPAEIRGPGGYVDHVKALMEPFADGRIIVRDFFASAEGDKAVVRYTWSATHTSEFAGIPATGRKVELEGIAVLRGEDGKLAEIWDGYDVLTLLRQLGAVPAAV
jgi:steroid delta-isomerase-like uncharacterized protein